MLRGGGAYNGIDNAFFVSRIGIPQVANNIGQYDVINLEGSQNTRIIKEIEERLVRENKNIIYTDHKPFPYKKIGKHVRNNNTVISDYPMDYLMVYRNACTVYSNRVHACIPTLAFGNNAVLYSESPRVTLFENLGATIVPGEPICIKGLKDKQQLQIDFLSNILRK